MGKLQLIEWVMIGSLVAVGLFVGVKAWNTGEIFKDPPAIQRPAN